MANTYKSGLLIACLLGAGPSNAVADCGPQVTSITDLAAALRTFEEMEGAHVLTIEKVALESDLCTQFWSVDILTEENDIDILIIDDATLALTDIDLEMLVILEVGLGRGAKGTGETDR